MINLHDLTNEQADYLAAKAQWELEKREFGDHYDTTDFIDYWIPQKQIMLSAYSPTTNGQQAMELLEKFLINLDFVGVDGWRATISFKTNQFVAPTPERAIVKAVVASIFGNEIDEGELG